MTKRVITVEAFKQFVFRTAKKSPRKVINHFAMTEECESAWGHCAVGDFIKNQTGERDPEACSNFGRMEGPLFTELPEVADALNRCRPDTYGQLAKLIRNETYGK